MIAAVPGVPAGRRDPSDLKCAETVEKDHGRIETRRIAVRTELPARLDEKLVLAKAGMARAHGHLPYRTPPRDEDLPLARGHLSHRQLASRKA